MGFLRKKKDTDQQQSMVLQEGYSAQSNGLNPMMQTDGAPYMPINQDGQWNQQTPYDNDSSDKLKVGVVAKERESEIIHEALKKIDAISVETHLTVDMDIDILLVTQAGYKSNVNALKSVKRNSGCAILGIAAASAAESFYEKVQADIVDGILTSEQLFSVDLLRFLASAYEVKTEGISSEEKELGNMHRIVAFTGPSATGKTTLAVNFAIALTKMHYKVLLVSAALQSDDVDILLDIRKKNKTVYDAVISDGSRDFTHLYSSIVHYKDLDLLLSPIEFTDADQINPNAFASMIQLCQSHYDYVVIDTATHIDDISDAVFSLATDIFLIVNQNVPSAAYGKKMLFFIRECGFTGAPLLLANETDMASLINVEEVEKIIGLVHYGVVPLDRRRNYEAANEGLPIIIRDRNCDYSSFLKMLAVQFTAGKPRAFEDVDLDSVNERKAAASAKKGKKNNNQSSLMALLTQDVGGSKNKKKK